MAPRMHPFMPFDTHIRLQTITGPAIEDAIPALQRVRAVVFREFPYLYDGDPAVPADYLAAYARSPRAAVVMAWDGDTPVGAATCLPLVDEGADTTAPFLARGWNLARFFYYGEAVLLPGYRGQGLGVRFFEAREAQARACQADFACFCAVRRAADHPARPSGYVPNDRFWRARGYAPLPGMTCHFTWKEIGVDEPLKHPLDFWGKSLSGVPLP